MVVVAVCPVHGAFESNFMAAVNSVGVTLNNNSESCPKCGSLSQVMEGTFNFGSNGIAEVVSAPAWTRAALKQVQQALADAKRRIQDLGEDPDAVAEETIRCLEHANPALASKFHEFLGSPVLSNVLNLILIFTTFVSMMSPGDQPWNEELFNRIVELEVENQQQQQRIDDLSDVTDPTHKAVPHVDELGHEKDENGQVNSDCVVKPETEAKSDPQE